ncbi:MAG: FAD-dependent oxidoreductase [Cyanobacteria bacterium Co-bin13]|nr:FAD-dependent oxidoreductase [Cyanobacteria bacterium Co-bin13]
MDYDYIVVGRGLTGSAAARHLAAAGLQVALMGPEEPRDRTRHTGVFASHYDEGRITRILDPNPYWARFAQRSIDRYRPLEEFTGISFYGEVGHLAVGQDEGSSREYLKALQQVAAELAVGVEILDRKALQTHFPDFQFYENAVGLWQRQQAGYLSPRQHVKAQVCALERLGGCLVNQEVLSVKPAADGVQVETAAGSYTAQGAILATGGFTHASNLLPQRLQLTVRAHTVLLAEVDGADLERLRHMPSLISKPCDAQAHFYLLPPIRYPDGHWYIKIGCSDMSPIADDLESLQRWFKGPGESAIADQLKALLSRTLPDVQFPSYWVDTCVTTHTPTGYPYIDRLGQSPIVTLLGGNGYAGKSADELGWIAANLLRQGQWTYDLEAAHFKLRYAV